MKRNKKERVAVYIDGSNFYYKLKDLSLKNLVYFQYGEFAKFLCRSERCLVGKRYYIGAVKARDEKSKKMQEDQVRLFSHLQSDKCRFSIQRGYLMKNDGIFHEKGVDVKIAVDILVGAYENLYDTAIVVSSDTDLIPALEKVKSLGKNVEYIGFSHKPSIALVSVATKSKLLDKNDILSFETPHPKETHKEKK
ncbi:MAG: NYN domain-containing protein [Candidatus Moranbacteria bacterium]|nr:NYN domain-containing protein [Candidatus Moranbacteria bacterium]